MAGYNLAVVRLTPGGAAEAEPRLVTLDTDGKEVIGIARLGNLLYVVCVKSDTIYIFNAQHPFERVGIITVPELKGMGPGDIVSDKTKNLLYIIDWRPVSKGDTRIWSVDPATWTVTYLMKAAHWTGTLSVISNHGILGVSGNGKLNCCNVETGATSSQNAISDPQHAVEKTTGAYFVSQGWKDGQPHRVVELDSSGTVLRHFGGDHPGSGPTELNFPRYLALTCCSGVMVADYRNRRVVQLNDDLERVGDILNHETTPGVGWPQRLYYSEGDNGEFQLFVAMAEKPMAMEDCP